MTYPLCVAFCSWYIDYGYAVETAGNLAADRVILTGEAAQLAGFENDLARLNPNIRELTVYTSDASQALQAGLGKNPVAAETSSKSITDTVNLGAAETSIAAAVIDEIGLHL